MEFKTDIFSQYDKKWALLTAGTKENFNTMTISWGGMGTLWSKPVVTVYVRESRLTHFTISFYPEEYKKTLGVLGAKSGRDMDKMKESGLTPKEVSGSMTFGEAEVTLLCKKLYMQSMDLSKMPEDVVKSMYADGDCHDMYIGEVVEIL